MTFNCMIVKIFFITSIILSQVAGKEVEKEEEIKYVGMGLSAVLDYIPFVGNVKNLVEGISGNDAVTGEDLTISLRALSFLGSIPFVNYLRVGKHLKNAQKFQKAHQRAKLLGKLKNAVSFGKAAVRQLVKSEKPLKMFKRIALGAKHFLKCFGVNDGNNE